MATIPDEYIAAAHPFYVLVVSDESGKGAGEPIVWERTFPVGVTLGAVMRQQQNLATRFGASYIAECRIIPESRRGFELAVDGADQEPGA